MIIDFEVIKPGTVTRWAWG